MSVGYYVTVQDAGRTGFLLGPYPAHEDALANVDRGKAAAQAADDRAVFYAFGTSKIDGPGDLPPGVLNKRIGLHA